MTKLHEPPRDSERLWDSREGYVAGTDGEGRPLVDFEGNPAGPRVALTTVPLPGATLEAAVASRQTVQLRFQDGDVRHPIIIGLARDARQEGVPHPLRGDGGTLLEVLEHADGVTLRVGKASLRLMLDGRIFLKGTYVETCAEGLNRIKGGTVDIG